MAKNNAHRRRMDRVSQQSRYSTPGELTCSRLKLAQELLTLIHEDRAVLPLALQERLRGLRTLLGEALAEARRLP